MLKTLPYIFFIFLLFFTGCGKNEFTLEFLLKEDITDNYNVTYFATDVQGGQTVQAVASVREGKCVLAGATKRPTLAFVTTRKSAYPLVIYADRGDKIIIKGDEKEPLSWEVEGNDIDLQLSEWRKENSATFALNERDSVNKAVSNFVEENPSNPVSTILMLTYYQRDADEREYTRLMSGLEGKAKDRQWLQICGRADQMSHSYSYPAKLLSLVMKSDQNKPDTLRIDSVNPVLIWFWTTWTSDRKETLDSLKQLKKEYADSVLLMADICVDIDSLGWRSAIRRDTLEPVKRFWAPTALEDSTVRKFKVGSLPYFIVFDKEGNQSYRGSELGEALNKYRSLFPEDSVASKKKGKN